MSCACATTRNVGMWFAFSSVIVSLGCAPGTEVPPPDRSNRLPTGVQAKGADFRAQIAPYAPINPHDRGRKAKCRFCWKTKVHIEALGDPTNIDPKNPPATGRPVAHLVNLDNKKTEEYYGLLPHHQADYYLWVDAKSGTQAQWTLLELSHSTDSVYAALPANLNYCHKDSTVTYTPDADFAEYRKEGACNVPIPETSPKVTQASLLSTFAFVALLQRALALLTVFAPSGGGWISCSNGCCT
jgi:hypothetical protein